MGITGLRLIFFFFVSRDGVLFLLSKRDKYQKTETFRSDSQYRGDKEKDVKGREYG